MNTIQTERLVLRPWCAEDAEALYRYASDPLVGPIAGWPAHTSVENSREVIYDVLSEDNTFAVCLKGVENEPIGSVGLMVGNVSNLDLPRDEAELGYWLGVPFWGNGYIPEACKALIDYGFDELDLDMIWCAYYEGNNNSKRVIEKCGFAYHHTNENMLCSLMNEMRTAHVYCLDRLALPASYIELPKEAKEKIDEALCITTAALLVSDGVWI